MSGPPVFSIFLAGEPVPASRPRVTKWGTHNSARYERWKRDATLILASRWRHLPISTAAAVCVEVVLPRPKQRPRTGQHARFWHPVEDYPLPIGGKWGDLDNYVKAALDALQSARVITDDCIVVELTATKHAGSQPGVHITVSLVEPDEPDEE